MAITKEQQAAYTYQGSRPAVISAAAGSGKTFVLAERVQYLLSEPRLGVRADRLAVVTFTEKAAAELKQRLTARLEYQVRESGSAYVADQLARLSDARISTISSFCLTLLRENVTYTPWDSGFAVLDETDAQLLKKEAARELLSRIYADNRLKKSFLGVFAGEYELESFLLSFHEFAVSLADLDAWLEKQEEAFTAEGYREAFVLPLRKKSAEIFYKCAEEMSCIAQDADGEEPYCVKVCDYLNQYADALDKMGEAVEAGDRRALKIALESVPKRLPAAKTDSSKELAEEIKARRDIVKKKSERALAYLEVIFPEADEPELCGEIFRFAAELYKIYADAYSRLKLERNSADFSDMEQELLKMLKKYPHIGEKISQQLDYIIVDEFQDSNDIQYEIFRRLSRQEKNLYFVGDVKQCIYGFRNANPYILSGLLTDPGWQPLQMNRNFRSSDSVIDSVNRLFSGEIPRSFNGGLPWENMTAGRGVAANEQNETELVLIDSLASGQGGDPSVREAEYVAARIKEMVKEGFEVFGSGVKSRPVTYGDFAILLRSESGRGAVFRRALLEAGIPVINKDDRNYTDLSEVRLVINLLKLLTNPFDDLALTTVLMSPLYRFDGEDMARLRLMGGGCLFAAVNSLAEAPETDDGQQPVGEISDELLSDIADKEKKERLARNTAEFIGNYRLLRKKGCDCTAGRLLRYMYSLTDMLSVMGVGAKGRERTENLRLLLHYGEKYDSVQEFIAFMENAAANKLEMKAAVSSEQEDSSVKIITIHSSKGLQYPVVFLCDTNRRPNMLDTTAPLIYDNTAGMGVMLSDMSKPARFTTACHKYAAQAVTDKQLGEGLRLLYVAMTRAMDKLIMTASDRQRKPGEQLPLEKAAHSDSYLSFLLAAAERDSNFCRFTRIGADKEIIRCTDGGRKKVYARPLDEAKIRENLAYSYPYDLQTRTPAKITATQLGVERSVMEDETDENAFYLSLPLFMKNGRQITGKEKGDIYHKVMENLDFSNPCAAEQLDAMEEDGTLTADERKAVEDRDIDKFLQSRLCARIAAAEEVQREFPVFTLVNAAEIPDAMAEDMSFLQGIADLYFVEDGEIVLVDYKTNRNVTPAYLVQTYEGQLRIYKKALEEMTGLPVRECVLYSFWLGEGIEVKSR